MGSFIAAPFKSYETPNSFSCPNANNLLFSKPIKQLL